MRTLSWSGSQRIWSLSQEHEVGKHTHTHYRLYYTHSVRVSSKVGKKRTQLRSSAFVYIKACVAKNELMLKKPQNKLTCKIHSLSSRALRNVSLESVDEALGAHARSNFLKAALVCRVSANSTGTSSQFSRESSLKP